MARFHKMAGGVLMTADDGHARFLTEMERFFLFFGIKPLDADSAAAGRIRREELSGTFKCAAFCVAIILFASALASVLSGCQSYQPPGEDIWRAL